MLAKVTLFFLTLLLTLGFFSPNFAAAATLDDLPIGNIVLITGENGAAYKFAKIIPKDDDGNTLPHSDGTNGSYWMLADNYCGVTHRPMNCYGKDTSGNTVQSSFQFWAETNADGNNVWTTMTANPNSIYLRVLMPFYNDLPDIIGGFDKDDMILTKDFPISSIRSDGGDTTTYKGACLLTAPAPIAITGDTLTAADVANCVWPDKVSLPSYTDWQDGLNRFNVFAGSSSSANAYVQARFGKPWNSNIDDNGFTWKPWTRSANGWAAPNGREVWQIHGAQPDFAVHGEPALSSFGVSPVLWLSSTLFTTGGAGTYSDPYQIDDKTPPTVTDFAADATPAPLDTGLTITFSEKIATTGTVSINGVTLSGSFDSTGMIFTIPDLPAALSPLTNATTYPVSISGFKDTTGNSLSPVTPSFTTILDTIKPTVTAFTPNGDFQDEHIVGDAVVTFSEPMNQGIIGAIVMSHDVGGDDEHIVTLSDGHFTSPTTYEVPYGILKPNTYYQVSITGFRDAAIKLPAPDTDGNLMDEDDNYNFLTETTDANPPEITHFTPVIPAAPLSGQFVMNWSTTMDLANYGTWKITLNGETLEATAGAWSDYDMTYTLDYKDLTYDTIYTVRVEGFTNWSHIVMVPQEFTFTTLPKPQTPISALNPFSSPSFGPFVCTNSRPGAPTLTSVQRTNPTQTTLFWSAGEGAATSWMIMYGKQGGALEYGATISDATTRVAVINDLDPHTNYTFQVIQLDSCAQSNPSNALSTTLSSTSSSDSQGSNTSNNGSSPSGSDGSNSSSLSSSSTSRSSSDLASSSASTNSASNSQNATDPALLASATDLLISGSSCRFTAWLWWLCWPWWFIIICLIILTLIIIHHFRRRRPPRAH